MAESNITRIDPDACTVRIVDADRVAAARKRMITNAEASPGHGPVPIVG